LEREAKTTALHGDKSQDERLKALEAFKSGEVDLLVCTDVAARLDIRTCLRCSTCLSTRTTSTASDVQADAGASGLAVTFAASSDNAWWLILKNSSTKIELEPMEFDEDQPRTAEVW
jgi:superfamily II DNA/RNA helicase